MKNFNRLKIIPRDYQLEVVGQMVLHDRCLLHSPTGSGKSNILIYLMMAIGKKTIIIVPKVDLITQTYNRILACTDIQPDKISIYKGRKPHVKPITLITWQSLASAMKDAAKWEYFKGYFQVVMCDECHKTGADKLLYTQGVEMLGCQYRYGFSATPERNDGSTRELIRFFDNNVVKVPIKRLYDNGSLIKPELYFIDTLRRYDAIALLKEWQKMIFTPEQQLGILKKTIGTDPLRNAFIMQMINGARGKCNLVLSYTTMQCEILHKMDKNENKLLIHGKLTKNEKQFVFKKIEEMEEVTIYATQSFLGEGTDIPKLDSLFVVTPFAGGTKTVQFAGRILRPYPGKQVVKIYDFVDLIRFNPYKNEGRVNELGWKEKREKEYKKILYGVDMA